ncbi:energy transducer TonB [Flavobacterium sp.]|uniref:energy transducer TonB n=1 Tax=Flavobacterium sp. TaxID=239 RepID=UPI003753C5C0
MKLIFQFLINFITISSIAQSSINYKDEDINQLNISGDKVGMWKLFDEKNDVKITIDYSKKENPKIGFYKNEKLIATYDKIDKLEIYKDAKRVKAKYFYRENGSQTLVDDTGKELDSETIKFYAQAAEVNAMFYGGIKQLYEFIGNNFNSNGQKGKMKVQFIIDNNGFTNNIEIIETSNTKLNDEAKRVISISPRWQPGYQGGDFVKTPYIIPININ